METLEKLESMCDNKSSVFTLRDKKIHPIRGVPAPFV